jgi:hypothetical protein
MKVLTLNFLTCAVKTCKASSDSFPLHPKDAELVSDDVELNPQLLVNLLPRIDWNALRTTSSEARISFSVSIPKSRMECPFNVLSGLYHCVLLSLWRLHCPHNPPSLTLILNRIP